MERPIQLIGSTEDGQLFVNKQAAEILAQQNASVSVVSIVGKYRTGKSYLMNRLFQSAKGFHVGPTIEAATKGIWVWARQHPKCESKCLILMDIEGLHDPKKGDSRHDMKLFSLAVLLSSCLVYNVVGALDNAFLQEFHLVSKLTDFIRVDSKVEETGTEFSQHFPKLFFVLRDFYLKLKLNEKTITPDEYMEDTLKLRPGRGKPVTDYNEPRECIRDFFPQRKCFALPRPIHDADRLAHMDQVQEQDIDPQFLQKAQEATDTILAEANELKVLGHVMNGSRFVQLLKVYVGGINKGTIPPIITAIENVKAKQCKIAIGKAVELYKQILQSSLEGCFPAESNELIALHKTTYDLVTDQYREQAMVDVKSTEQLQVSLDAAYQEFVNKNNEASREKCKQLIKNLFSFMADTARFQGPGGYEAYTNMINKAAQEYHSVNHKGPLGKEILQSFLKDRQQGSERILVKDEALTEDRRNQERQMNVRKRKLDDEVAEEEIRKRLKLEVMRQQDENVKLLEKMRTDFEERQDYLMKKYQEDIKVKEDEHRRLQEENMAKQSEKMEVLLERMHNEFKAKDVVIKKQQDQIEEFKKGAEEIMKRLESDVLTKEEMLAASKNATTTNVKEGDAEMPSSSLANTQTTDPDIIDVDIAATITHEDEEMQTEAQPFYDTKQDVEVDESIPGGSQTGPLDIKETGGGDAEQTSQNFTDADVQKFVADLEEQEKPSSSTPGSPENPEKCHGDPGIEDDDVDENPEETERILPVAREIDESDEDDADDSDNNSNYSEESLRNYDQGSRKRCVIS